MTKLKNNKPVEKEQVDMFCKLSKVVFDSVSLQIKHNESIKQNPRITFLEEEKNLIE